MSAELFRRLARLERIAPPGPPNEEQLREAAVVLAMVDAFHFAGWRPGDDLCAAFRTACTEMTRAERDRQVAYLAGPLTAESRATLPWDVSALQYADLFEAIPGVTTAHVEAALLQVPQLEAIDREADIDRMCEASRLAGFNETYVSQRRARLEPSYGV